MARLTTAQRNALPTSAFAGPDRSYPVNDAAHARNAKSRVAQFGGPLLQKKVDSKADAKLDAIKTIQKRRKGADGRLGKVKPKPVEPDADQRGGPSDMDADD